MDQSEPTPLRFPSSTLFPVIVTALLVDETSAVDKHMPILRYKYWNMVDVPVNEANGELPKKVEEEFFGTFESPIKGELKEWNVTIGSEISDPNFVFARILEPCTHSVQYAGLCALCGAKVDEVDYTEFSNQDRAPIAMSHDSTGLKVSFDEAQRMEKSSSSQLLKNRKLILVVDLDQTVIHAAVDPTIEKWQSDPSNPNYEAVKDVQSFVLLEEGYGPGKVPVQTHTRYYVKLRPGLKEFFEQIHNLYEMHVYTMATRAYAVAIAKIIDPEGKYFGDRILSRDESGSMAQKSLKRLFPVSTAMVAIIDDRGDVWKWSPNLIKVVPYSFFVGIGDINSSFLPQQNLTPPPDSVSIEAVVKDDAKVEELPVDADGKVEEPKEDTETPPIHIEYQAAEEEGVDSEELLAIQSFERSQLIESQKHESPLAKQQELIEQEEEKEEQKEHTPEEETPVSNGTSDSNGTLEHKSYHRKLLHDDDTELVNLNHALTSVHDEYYKEYDKLVSKKGADTLTEQDLPDIGVIMPRMKRRVFHDCVILFSGVLPLGVALDQADIVQWVRSFGAIVVAELIDTVTHVIAVKNGTAKVRRAFERPDVKVVHLKWLYECIAHWKRVPEENFYLERPEGSDMPIPEDERAKKAAVNDDNVEDIDTDSFVLSLNDGKIDWNEINKELDEFMNSSDEEDSNEDEAVTMTTDSDDDDDDEDDDDDDDDDQ